MLEKTYQPALIEARIHAAWEQADAFRAGAGARSGARNRPYCIVIPPPNVTGSLHMGHALNNTVQDVLCRFERMRGRDVLWQPGTDHAGIATQMVVERQLAAEKQPSRRELGRERFLEKVWAWKEESGGTILNQLKRLGASCDWSRERFTMDPGLSKAVLKVFVELYRAKLIYKDKRLVNWDPKFQTAISDLEVEQVDKKGSFRWTRGEADREGGPVALNHAALGKLLDRDPSGHMYYFNYPLEGAVYSADDPATFITIATTRPETMLADTAVAVHPTDERSKYRHLVGKRVLLPLAERAIPVIGDAYADPEKGTGAVKITPAHDFNDFEVGKRHNLAQINILDAFARLNENAPERYRGLDRFAARKKVVADLDARGMVARIEPTAHTVPHGDRSGVPIEPWLTDQWYVDAATLAKPALEAVRAGKTRFVPERFANDYYRWLENIQPWCISRQLWWGHQIPAWYGPDGQVFVADDEAEARALAHAHYASGGRLSAGESPDAIRLRRDEDVLDTWFSSALWPFSTLGWPDETPELKRYYPTATLVTGFDIIFFWVARMMMTGLHFMGEVPFETVYIHGLVRDAAGQKMSKSKGNVLDPLVLIDKYGADALRFTLAAMAAQGADVKFSEQRIEGYRNFATKLWNAARFAEMNGCARVAGFDPKATKETVNRWIAGEVERTAAAVTRALEEMKLNDAAGLVYEFVWGRTCDWYLELIKPVLTGSEEAAKAETRATAAWVLDEALRLLHPFMPFVTEELWAKTGEAGPRREGLLAHAAWPEHAGLADPAADAEMGWVVRLVSEVRSVRAEMNVPAAARVALVLVEASAEARAWAGRHAETIARLARLEGIAFEPAAPKGAAVVVFEGTTAAIPLAGIIDLEAERTRLAREIDRTEADRQKAEAWLANAANVARSPEHVVALNRERLAEGRDRIARLSAALKRLEG